MDPPRPVAHIGLATAPAIASAIANRQRVAFRYHGHRRVVEPHILGTDTRGRPSLSGYQVGGGSTSGESVGWKLFHLAELQGLEVLDRRFQRPRPDYNPQDPIFARIDAQV